MDSRDKYLRHVGRKRKKQPVWIVVFVGFAAVAVGTGVAVLTSRRGEATGEQAATIELPDPDETVTISAGDPLVRQLPSQAATMTITLSGRDRILIDGEVLRMEEVGEVLDDLHGREEARGKVVIETLPETPFGLTQELISICQEAGFQSFELQSTGTR